MHVLLRFVFSSTATSTHVLLKVDASCRSRQSSVRCGLPRSVWEVHTISFWARGKIIHICLFFPNEGESKTKLLGTER